MKLKLFMILLFVIFLVYLLLNFDKNKKIDRFLEEQTKLFISMYTSHYNSYKEKSRILFDSLVTQKEVLQIYTDLQNANKEEKDLLRKELYEFLKEQYSHLEYTQLKQLHFHLKNNDSFLRMHKPSKFGDNLTHIREGIAYVNKNVEYIDGFEMGRVYSGLRFVYPIINRKKEHLGSVEVSFDISIFSREFMKHFNVLTNFHLDGNIIEKKAWNESIIDNYIKSPVLGYYLEKRNTKVLKEFAKKLNLPILETQKSTIKKALESINLDKAISLYDKDTRSVITFLPIKNRVTNEVVAFFSIRNFEGYVTSIVNNYRLILAISTFFITSILLLLYKELKRKDSLNEVLKRKVDEETKELKKLNKQLSLYKNVLDNTDAGATISQFDKEEKRYKTVYINKVFEKITGYSEKEVLGESLRLLQGKDTEESAKQIIFDTIKNKKSCEVEILNYKKSGEAFYNRITLSPLFDEEGEVTHYIGIQDDITEKKKRELETIQQKNFLDTLIQTAPIPFFYKNKNGEYIDVNKTWCNFTGFSREEIVGKSVYDVAPKDIADIYHEQDAKVFNLEENPQVYESKVINKIDKKEHDVMFYKSAFFNPQGEVEGLIGSLIDLTVIKKLQDDALKKEKLLFEQSKLASMGEMMTNIAHQWRQPLSVISTIVTSLTLQRDNGLLTDELFASQCDAINKRAQYLSSTIDDFRDFITGDDDKIAFNIKNSIESFLHLTNLSTERFKVKLVLDIDEDITVSSYPNQIKQCLVNIHNNAIDILKEKEEDRLIFISTKKEDEHVIISFRDNAGGIPKDVLPRIFEPYFTTKHQTQGTGLGLHMTYNLIVNAMQGTIEAKTLEYIYNDKEYKGAEFIIKLPIS